MMKRVVMFLAAVSVATLSCGHIPAACADWRPPVVILPPQPPQPPQPLPQPLTIKPISLEPALKAVPSAPQAVTTNGQASSPAGSGYSNPATEPSRTESYEPAKVETRPEPPPVKAPDSPPVSHPSASESKLVPADGDTGGAPATGRSKVPWLLAGVVAGAFFLGRRSRRR